MIRWITSPRRCTQPLTRPRSILPSRSALPSGAGASLCSRTWTTAQSSGSNRTSRYSAGLVELATVDGDGEKVGDGEDADEAGERDPDVFSDGLLGEQGADAVHDGGDGLVLGEPGDRAAHRVGGHEGGADERQ